MDFASLPEYGTKRTVTFGGDGVKKLIAILKYEEGFYAMPYPDGAGHSVGYGHHIESHGESVAEYAKPVTKYRAEVILVRDAVDAAKAAGRVVPGFAKMNEARRIAFASMAFQLGETGLKAFRETIRHATLGEWRDVYEHCLKSKWAKQTPHRCTRTAITLRDGVLCPEWEAAVNGDQDTVPVDPDPQNETLGMGEGTQKVDGHYLIDGYDRPFDVMQFAPKNGGPEPGAGTGQNQVGDPATVNGDPNRSTATNTVPHTHVGSQLGMGTSETDTEENGGNVMQKWFSRKLLVTIGTILTLVATSLGFPEGAVTEVVSAGIAFIGAVYVLIQGYVDSQQGGTQ